MKVWDDNFVADTGTARDGRVTTMTLLLFFFISFQQPFPPVHILANHFFFISTSQFSEERR